MSKQLYPLVSLLLINACAVGPDYQRPDIALPTTFKEAPAADQLNNNPDADQLCSVDNFETLSSSAVTVAAEPMEKAKPQDDTARGKWWLVFNDNDLSALEEEVAAHNQTVKAAEGSFHQARALVAEARAAYFPTVTANASMTRNKSAQLGNITGRGNTAIDSAYNASLDASWMPDFWGRVRREVESSKASAEASAADLALAILSAQSQLAIAYLNLRVADEQKRVLENTVTAYTKSLQITQNQYAAGIAASSDVLQAKVQLENTQAQLVDVGVQRAQYEHAVAVLVGKVPAEFSIPVVNSVPALPVVPTGILSALLQRRPDIAAAERNVMAANAQIGVAEAAYFPDITLSASGGYESSALSRLFSLPSRFWSIGPSLAEAVFDAGLRSAQTEAAIAAYDTTVGNYRQAVLESFREVEDNLAALRLYAQEAEVLDSAVLDANKAVEVITNQYASGTVNYLNVITAQTAALNSELTALNVRKERLTAAATLIEDLGGGWTAAELAKPSVTQGETTPFSIFPPPFKRP